MSTYMFSIHTSFLTTSPQLSLAQGVHIPFCLNFMSYFYIYLFVYLFEFTLIGLTINAAHIFMGTGTITVTPFLKKRSFPRSY